MPGWHAFTQRYRDEGLLEVVGIATEQHPARTRLFAQWQGFDWPILWDPFNLTGSAAVPNHIFVDEFGIVRSTRPDQATFEDELLFADFGGTPSPSIVVEGGAAALLETVRHAEGSFEHAHYRALSDLLWPGGGDRDAAIEVLEAQAAERSEDPRLAFRAGVARRMRFDSDAPRSDDFQAAVDHWTAALAGDPAQYIWRRRIQQYGPRMDKPYNFYSWIETARSELIARGQTPVALVATLTPAELAESRTESPGTAGSEPDPEGSVPRDEAGLVAIETAVAFDTSKDRSVASVHLALRPNAKLDAHWNHEVDALRVWIDAEADVVEARLLADPPRSDVATSDELRTLSFEASLPDGVEQLTFPAYALYYVCAGEEGTCQYLRRDFEVSVKRP